MVKNQSQFIKVLFISGMITSNVFAYDQTICNRLLAKQINAQVQYVKSRDAFISAEHFTKMQLKDLSNDGDIDQAIRNAMVTAGCIDAQKELTVNQLINSEKEKILKARR